MDIRDVNGKRKTGVVAASWWSENLRQGSGCGENGSIEQGRRKDGGGGNRGDRNGFLRSNFQDDIGTIVELGRKLVPTAAVCKGL